MRWNIRNTVNTLPHDRSRLLVNEGLPTKKFSESIDRWIKTMLEDDVSENGYSSNTVSANIISKEEGIISGQIVGSKHQSAMKQKVLKLVPYFL